MYLDDLLPSGEAAVFCSCGHGPLTAVDRYVTDWPPIPRGRNPESFVEFYRGPGGDPDDRLLECPGCGDDLELAHVNQAKEMIP